jgi:hypothetical protein
MTSISKTFELVHKQLRTIQSNGSGSHEGFLCTFDAKNVGVNFSCCEISGSVFAVVGGTFQATYVSAAALREGMPLQQGMPIFLPVSCMVLVVCFSIT